jgi:hypothetical protein
MSKRIALSLALIGLAALVVAATVISACSDSETPPKAGDATPDEPITTIEAGSVAPDEPITTIEAGGLEWRRADLTAVGYDAMRIVEAEDGFLALGYKIDEGEITTWSSEDGQKWTEVSTDTEALQPGEFIMEVVATPGGYLATGGEAEWWWGEGPVDRMWTSEDGATWTRHDFDQADVAQPSPYVTGEGTIQGIVAGAGEIVLVGTSVLDLNHQAILDEIAPGTDASDEMMTGIGILEPSGKAGVEYAIDGDWVRMTFEEMGLSDEFVDKVGSQTIGVWHSPDGSSWMPCPEATEWKVEEYAPSLVAGPNGYFVDGGDMLYVSPDAENWSEIPAEAAFGTPTTITSGHVTGWKHGWAAIVGAGVVPREGPVEGTDFYTEVNAILTSTDGTAWAQSVVPTSMLLSEEQASLESLCGGEFGLFALLSPESDEPDLSGAELWWSADAVTWDPIQVGTTFGTDRVVWDLTISTDRVVVLAADWTGWQDAGETEEDIPAPLEIWLATKK